MKRVVIFAHQCKPFHEPGREVASQRAHYFARYLPGAGWDCTVFCATREGQERVLEGPGWRIIGVPSADLPAGRQLWQELKDRDAGGAFRKGLSWWYAGHGDNGIVWAPRAVERAMEIHRKEPFDAVIGEHSPDGGVEAASQFFRLTGIAYVIDLRDPVGILFDKNARKFSYFQQRSRGAALITSTSASWVPAFEAAYKLPVWVLTHAYDESELDAARAMHFDAPTIVYAGSTYIGQRWDAVARAIDSTDGGLRFWSAGHGAWRIREALRDDGRVKATVLDSVPRERALSAQKGATALLLVSHHGGCVSARTFEHIASGAPIIYFPADGSEIESRIRQSGARFRVVADENELGKLFREIVRGGARWDQMIGDGDYTRYSRARQAERLGQILDGVCFDAEFPSKFDLQTATPDPIQSEVAKAG